MFRSACGSVYVRQNCAVQNLRLAPRMNFRTLEPFTVKQPKKTENMKVFNQELLHSRLSLFHKVPPLSPAVGSLIELPADLSPSLQTVVNANGTFNWDCFKHSPPPPQQCQVDEDGTSCEVYLEAAEYLKALAKAAHTHMQTWSPSRSEIAALVRGRSHSEVLGDLLTSHLTASRVVKKERQQQPGCHVMEEEEEEAENDTRSFMVLLTASAIMERLLYDIYHHQQASGKGGGGSGSKVEVNNNSNGDGDGGGDGGDDGEGDGRWLKSGSSLASPAPAAPPPILRDLLGTDVMQRAMPLYGAEWLLLLFSPRCLNLRNLLWHGFLAPNTSSPEYSSLVLLLALSLPSASARPCWLLNTASDITVPQPDHHPSPHHHHTGFTSSRLELAKHLPELEAMVSASLLVPSQHTPALKAALGACARGHTAEFMILALPALEHSLRLMFAAVNNSPRMLRANVMQYYSTLDGFGQKSKHQLLLEDEVRSELRGGRVDPSTLRIIVDDRPANLQEDEEDGGTTNKLLPLLGSGAVACCLDLFLLEAGPGLRGKLSHGEMDMRRVSETSSGDFSHQLGLKNQGTSFEMANSTTTTTTTSWCSSPEDSRVEEKQPMSPLETALLGLLVALCAEHNPHFNRLSGSTGGNSTPTSLRKRNISDLDSDDNIDIVHSSIQASGDELHRHQSESTTEAPPHSDAEFYILSCMEFVRSYKSVFHPNVRLQKSMLECRTQIQAAHASMRLIRHQIVNDDTSLELSSEEPQNHLGGAEDNGTGAQVCKAKKEVAAPRGETMEVRAWVGGEWRLESVIQDKKRAHLGVDCGRVEGPFRQKVYDLRARVRTAVLEATSEPSTSSSSSSDGHDRTSCFGEDLFWIPPSCLSEDREEKEKEEQSLSMQREETVKRSDEKGDGKGLGLVAEIPTSGVVPSVDCLRCTAEGCQRIAQMLTQHVNDQLAAAAARSLRTSGRRQFAQLLHARESVLLTLHLVMLGVETQVWEQKPEDMGYSRKLFGFLGTLETLCELQRYAEAIDKAEAFFSTKASRNFFKWKAL